MPLTISECFIVHVEQCIDSQGLNKVNKQSPHLLTKS